jgi:molecular chaperone GrpE (heat shock protein)
MAGDVRHRNPEEEEPQGRPKVKVTDKRRVRPDGEAPAGESSADTPVISPGEEPVAGTGESALPKDDLDAAQKQTAEYREHLQRLAAEFDNYRKRVLKEQTRAVEMAAEPLVRRLLEVLDEFDLALMAAEQRPDFDRFLHGVELVYAKLKEILRSEGLEPIAAEGKPFDPSLHEALMQGGEAEGDPVVADVLRPGYTMKGRVIRPAGVKVVRK